MVDDNNAVVRKSRTTEKAQQVGESNSTDLLAGMEALMGIEEIRLGFEEFANVKGFDLSCDFFNLKGDANPYTEMDARLAYEIWCTAIHTRLIIEKVLAK